VKLYNSMGPNPKLVRMFAAEKGYSFSATEEVDLGGGANRREPYLSKNPAGQLPCVELPDGRIVDVRPVDGIGFDLYSEIEADPSKGAKIWEIAARCLPSLTLDEVKTLTPSECAAVIAVALGKVKEVQKLAEEVAGKSAAPTTAEPESPRSPTPSDSSASASHDNAASLSPMS